MSKSEVFLLVLSFVSSCLGKRSTIKVVYETDACNVMIQVNGDVNKFNIKVTPPSTEKVKCRNENQGYLHIVKTMNIVQLKNVNAGEWYCDFSTLTSHLNNVSCTFGVDDPANQIPSDGSKSVDAYQADDTTILDPKQWVWIAVGAVATGLALICVFSIIILIACANHRRRKVKELREAEIANRLSMRPALKLPSEIVYDYVYSHFSKKPPRH